VKESKAGACKKLWRFFACVSKKLDTFGQNLTQNASSTREAGAKKGHTQNAWERGDDTSPAGPSPVKEAQNVSKNLIWFIKSKKVRLG
jgi:hypothetical protein